jgi:hypothetical protein
VVHPDRPIISFSGMEIETACRYRPRVKVVVLNNGGIGSGVEELPKDCLQSPPRSLTVGARDDRMMEASVVRVGTSRTQAPQRGARCSHGLRRPRLR